MDQTFHSRQKKFQSNQTIVKSRFESIGTIQYGPGIRAVVNVDQEIAEYYRSLTPLWLNVQPQKYPAHISFVRHESPSKMEFWGKYEGEKISFHYFSGMIHDDTYYWLDVECEQLKEIRAELGLPPKNLFHITIGNTKTKASGLSKTNHSEAFVSPLKIFAT